MSGSEIRRDILQDGWVIFAPGRSGRPFDLPRRNPAPSLQREHCRYCAGYEDCTGPELDRERGEGGWLARVVADRRPDLCAGGGCQGASEIVIESPRHILSLTELSENQVANILALYRRRLAALGPNAILFKEAPCPDSGRPEHSHSRIIGTRVDPPMIAQEKAASRRYFDEKGECLFCRILATELDSRERVVMESDSFVAFCPYASRFSYETWIAPRRHAADFAGLLPEETYELAFLLRRMLARIERRMGGPNYGFALHSAGDAEDSFHWHLEIVPRNSSVAGFEWGSGSHINTVLPEDAARTLRHESGAHGA